jgi:hypothetical protein
MSSVVGGVVSGMAWVTFGSPHPAAADVRVRFVNGRELVAREHWYAGTQVWFTHGRGTVGVPRGLVASIAAVDAPRGIGGSLEAVNATPLVAPTPIR